MKRMIQISLLTPLLFMQATASAESFSQIYQQALNFDPQTKSAQLQAQSVQTTIRQAKARLYPAIQLSAGYSQNRYEYNPKYADKKLEQGLYSVGVQINQSLYDPRVYANIKVQKSKSQLSQLQYQYQALTLAQDTLQAYLELIRSQEKIKLLQSYVTLNQSKLQKVQKQYKLHLSSQIEVLQAQVDLDNAQIELKKQKNLHQTNLVKLRKFIGDVPVHTAQMTLEDPKVLQKVQAMQAYIEQQANQTDNNPQIQYAQASVVSAQAQIQQAKSDYWPKINLTASYNHYATDTPNNQNSYDNTSSLGLNLMVPLYSGGQTNAQVEGAQLLKKAAQQDLLNAKNNLQVQWKEAKASFDNAVNLLPMYLHAVQASKLYLQAQQKKYQKGLASLIEVNDAINKLYQTQFKYIDNMASLTQSYITLLVVANQIQGLRLADTLLIEKKK